MATSLFFIRNAQHNTKTLEVYLGRRDYTVETESSIPEAIEKVKANKPSYVFIAWDHTDKSIKNIASLLPDDAVVIPYITSVANTDTRKLMALDVPLKLFPPLTGPGIQRLISKYEKDRSQMSGQNRIAAAKNDRDDDKQVYVNKGERFRDMNSVIMDRVRGEKLEGISGTGSDVVSDSQSHFNAFFDSITDVTKEKPTAQFSRSMHVKISPAQKHALEMNFDAKIQENLKEIIETAKESTPANQKQTTYCMLVQSIDCSGLILLNTEWNISSEEAESALSSWANELTNQFQKNEGAKNIYQSDIFSINAPQDQSIFEISKTKSCLTKELVIEGKVTSMAFCDLQHNPFTLQSADNENYLIINHNCLKEGSTITFDLYFELKENKKMLKIFKKNTPMTKKELRSILEKNILPLLISMSDEIQWYKYGVEAYLKQV